MAQGLRAQTTAVLSLVPSTHIVWLTTASNSRFRVRDPHLMPASAPTFMYTDTYIHT